MQEPLAGTQAWPSRKISAPRARALVSRPRLLRPLHEAAARGRIVLIVAPGGTGKTSLLADWAGQAQRPVAWYSLDVADRDARRLASGILAAIDHVVPGAAASAERVLEQGAGEVAVMGVLLSALENIPLTLVLDDFHNVDNASDAAPLWEHFFRFRPPSVSLVILSRTVPLLGFTALAAADSLLGLGLTDLTFSEEETAALLAAHGLDANAGPSLSRMSDGWAAGALLLARAGQGSLRQLRIRHDVLLDQLGGEMLGLLPSGLRAFLLESASLGSVSAAEADGILERHDSASRFADLLLRGLFLDHHDGIYRYHDLFADYLMRVLSGEAPERLHAIRTRAAAWWEEHGDVPRALALLAAEEDWPALAALLERSRRALWTKRLWGTIIGFVEQLPSSERSVLVLELCGYAYAERGQFAKAVDMADSATAVCKSDEEWLRATLLIAQTLILSGRYAESIQVAETGLQVAQRVEHELALSRLLQLRGRARLGLGRLDEGRADLLSALELHQRNGRVEYEAGVLAQLATQLTQAGHIADVEDFLVRAGTLWRRQGHTIALAIVTNTWARLHALRGDLIAARAESLRSLELLQNEAHPLSQCEATVTLAEICADAGDLAEAEQRASEAADLAARLDAADLLNAALRVRIAVALARRDRAGARRLIDEARTLAITPVDGALLDYCEGVHALRARATGRAMDLFARAAKTLEAVHRPHYAARALLLLAEAALGGGAQLRAEAALNRMTDLVSALGCEGYLRAPARMARQVHGERHLLRRLRKRTQLLLDRLASGAPTLSLVRAPAPEEEAQPARPALSISPFGQGRLALGERRIDGSALPPKARELLFYAARATRPIPRAELLETLWNDEERAAQNLWDASRHLRRLLGDQAWSSARGRYALQLAVHHAGVEFEQLAAAALGKGETHERITAAERALRLAGEGGYLEWCDSLWVHAERERAMTRAMHVALALGTFYQDMARRQEALAVFRRAVAFAPYEEAPRLALLRALAADGQVEIAVQEYNAYQRLLREELDAEPSSTLRALAAKITSGT